MKTWEESWTAHKDVVILFNTWHTLMVPHIDDTALDSENLKRMRAQLASAAPDMARVLLMIVKESETGVSDLADSLRQEIRFALVDALKKAGVDEGYPTDGDWSKR